MARLSFLVVLTVGFALPAFAQGQGGYPDGAPGAATAAGSANSTQHLRRHHLTNDMSGGTSSIDRSGQTQEGGGAIAGAHGTGNQALGASAPGNTGATKTAPTR